MDKTAACEEQRRGPDIWVRLLHGLAVLAWLLLLALLIAVETARPQFESFFDRVYGLDLRTTWDMRLAPWIGMITAAGLCISGTGLLISLRRYRRREDGFPVSLLLTAAAFLISLTACIRYL